MAKKIKWRGETLKLVKRHFMKAGTMTVFLIDETNFPHLKISLNGSKQILNDNEIIVKDYGENKGIKDVLINAGLLIPTGNWVEINNEICEICEVIR